jgi:NitT/TauT family transport system substrate-binding protein
MSKRQGDRALKWKRLLTLGCAIFGAFSVLACNLSDSTAAESGTGTAIKASIGTTGITAAIWPLMVGIKEGFFRDHGIDLEIVHIQNASVNVQDLVAGNLHFVSAGADAAILPTVHGANLAVIGGIDNLFVGRLVASNGIKFIQDLKGKILSVSRRNGPDAAIMTEMLANSGIKVEPTLFSVAGGSASRLAAVVNGGAAATLLIPPLDFRALKAGLKDLGLNVGRSKPLQFNVVFIDRKWGEANRSVVVKVLQGLIDSCVWLNNPKNREEASKILASYTKIDTATAKQTYDVLVTDTHSFPRAGELSRRAFENVIAMLARFGVIQEPLPALEKFTDDSYLKEASK